MIPTTFEKWDTSDGRVVDQLEGELIAYQPLNGILRWI